MQARFFVDEMSASARTDNEESPRIASFAVSVIGHRNPGADVDVDATTV